MEVLTHITDEEVFETWYEFVSGEPGFVGYFLKLLRDKESTTPEEQQISFGLDDQSFRRLQAMPAPRPNSVSKDAYRIAIARNLRNPFAFVQAMVLAFTIERATPNFAEEAFYQAAFDPETDLDDIPEME